MRRKKKAKESKRGIGEKNEKGITKSLIVLYIIEKGTAKTDEIAEYLGEKNKQRNIKTKHLIYEHLKKLEKDIKVLRRVPSGNNIPDSFFINEDFQAFIKIYRSLEKYGYRNRLMETSYYRSFIESPSFKAKLLINVLKEMLLKTYEEAEKDDTSGKDRNEIISELERSKFEYAGKPITEYVANYFEFSDSLKLNDKNDPNVKERDAIVNILNNTSIDDLYNNILKSLNAENLQNIDLTPQQYLEILASLMIPDKDDRICNNILKCSPSAIERIINIRKHSPTSFFGLLIRFFIEAQAIDIEKMGLLKSGNILTKEDFIRLKDYSRIENDSPIVLLLKSAYIQDYLDDQIIPNEFSELINDQLFKPRIKEGEKI